MVKFIKKLIDIIFNSKAREHYTYETLLELIAKHETSFDESNLSEHSLLSNIISLRNVKLSHVMTPRADIVAVKSDFDIDSALSLFNKSGYSRLPIYSDSMDNIIGFVHIKDLIPSLRNEQDLLLNSLLRKVLFISPYMKILDLLYEMKSNRIHMAMVVDEFGGVDGLITMEDIIEEILGDITDEYDKIPRQMIKHLGDDRWEVDARLPLETLEEKLDKPLFSEDQKSEIRTVGGLIISLLGYIPTRNEVIVCNDNLEFTVIAADALKIHRVRVSCK